MKPLFLVLALGWLFASCGDEGQEARKDVDNALEKVEKKAGQLADSAKERYKDVRDHLDTALDRDNKDTAR